MAGVGHHTDQVAQLRPCRESRRDRTVVGRLVVLTARRREPDGAGLECIGELSPHPREVVVGRLLLERALTHRPRAQRRVADVGRVVDRLRQPVDGVEVLGEGLPPPLQRRQRLGVDVLGSFEVAHHERPGVVAHRREGEPAVPHHRGRHAVPARVGALRVPEHLGVEVRVAVDEPGRHDVALGVDLPVAPLADPAHPGDHAVDDPDVAAIASRSRSRRPPGRCGSPRRTPSVYCYPTD